MLQKGFYLYTPNKDYFFVTDIKCKTRKLIQTVNQILTADGCTYRGKYGGFTLREMLQGAQLEKKRDDQHGTYYDVFGNGFFHSTIACGKKREMSVHNV